MAIIEQKVIKEIRLEKSVGQVRVIVDNVIIKDGVELLRTEGHEVYTEDTSSQLRLVDGGNSYADLMGW